MAIQDQEIRKGMVSVDLSTGMNQAESEYSLDPSTAPTYIQNAWIRNDGELEMRPGARRVFYPNSTSRGPICMLDDRNFVTYGGTIASYVPSNATTYSEQNPYYVKSFAPSLSVKSLASSGDTVGLGGDNFSQRPCGSVASDDYICIVHFRPNDALTGKGTYVTDIYERDSGGLVYSDNISGPTSTDCSVHISVMRDGDSANAFVMAYVSDIPGTHTYSIRSLVKDKSGSSSKFTASTPTAQTGRLLRGLICLNGTAYVVSAASGGSAYVDKYAIASDGTIGSATNTAFPANFQPDAANYVFSGDTTSTSTFLITGVNTSTSFARYAIYNCALDTYTSDTTTAKSATYGTNRVLGCYSNSTVYYVVTGTSSKAYPSVAGSLTTGTVYDADSGKTLYGWLPTANLFADRYGVYLPAYGYATGGVQTEHILIRIGSSAPSDPYSGREVHFPLHAIIDQELSGAPISTSNYFPNHCVPLDTRSYITANQRNYSSNFYCVRRKNSAGSCSYHAIELKHTFSPLKYQNGPSGLHVSAGAIPLYDDGKRTGELGIIGIPQVSAVLKTAGTTLTGSYVYYAVYVASDNKGNVTYSRVTNLPAITASGDDFELVVLAPTVTARIGGEAGTNYNIRCDIYRTQAGLTTPYLLCTTDPAFSTRVMTSAGNGWYTYTDSISDSTLATSQVMFRQPGVPMSAVDRYVPPASNVACVHKDRIWWGDPYGDVWYSAPFLGGEQPWTNPFFKVAIPFGTGPVTMIQSFNGRLYVGKKDLVCVIDGDGPPENGGNGTEFSIPTVMMDGFGPIHERGSCSSPTAIFFRTARGIEAIGPSGPAWVGKRVRRTLDLLEGVSSAYAIPEETVDMVYHPYTGHVYCMVQNYLYDSSQDTSAGTFTDYGAKNCILVYDTARDLWFTWAFNCEFTSPPTGPSIYTQLGKSTLLSGMAADVSSDEPSLIIASGGVMISRIMMRGQTSVTGVTTGYYYTDDVAISRAPIQMVVNTGHVKVSGPIGKVRIYDAIAMATVSQSGLQYVYFRTFTNYSTSADASFTRDDGDNLSYPQYFNWNPPKENVNAQRLSLLITSVMPTGNGAPAFGTPNTIPPVLHSLSFQVGEKPGIPLVGTSQKGTS